MKSTLFVRDYLAVLTLVLFLFPSSARPAEASPAGVRVGDYAGWTNTFTLDNGEVRAVIVPEAGGRILRYALHHENILWENTSLAGQSAAQLDGRSAGGYQIDIGPELRGMPPHKALWAGAYDGRIPAAWTARVTSQPDPGAGVQITKEITLDPDNGDLGLLQSMRNTSGETVRYCLWDRTLVLGSGFAIIPLNRRSRFENRWALRVKDAEGRWQYDGNAPAPREVEVIRNHLIVRCHGPATKVGADSAGGWIAYARGRQLFVKYFPYFANGDYTDGGCSVEVYFDERFGELEPLSPEVELKPGESYTFPEKWTLIELDEHVNTPADAQRAARRIPPSPFK